MTSLLDFTAWRFEKQTETCNSVAYLSVALGDSFFAAMGQPLYAYWPPSSSCVQLAGIAAAAAAGLAAAAARLTSITPSVIAHISLFYRNTHIHTRTHTSHAILPTTIPICPFADRPLAVYSWKLDCSCTAAVRTYRRCSPDRNYAEIPACFCQISTEVRSSVQTDIDRFFRKSNGSCVARG